MFNLNFITMRQFYLFTILGLCSLLGFSQTTVTVNTSDNIVGFANVFELPENGGAYAFGSDWGLPDMKTVIDADDNTITLQPNFNTYDPDDEFWVDPSTGEGNKIFEGNTYVENSALAGQTVTFEGNVIDYTISSEYEVTAYIKALDPNNNFATVVSEIYDIDGVGSFSITANNIPDGLLVQYGYAVIGVNANPADEAALGSVVVEPANLSSASFNKAKFAAYPNPTYDAWTFESDFAEITSIKVFDINGRLVAELANSQDNVLKIDASSLESGLYFANVKTENSSETIKLIKK